MLLVPSLISHTILSEFTRSAPGTRDRQFKKLIEIIDGNIIRSNSSCDSSASPRIVLLTVQVRSCTTLTNQDVRVDSREVLQNLDSVLLIGTC